MSPQRHSCYCPRTWRSCVDDGEKKKKTSRENFTPDLLPHTAGQCDYLTFRFKQDLLKFWGRITVKKKPSQTVIGDRIWTSVSITRVTGFVCKSTRSCFLLFKELNHHITSTFAPLEIRVIICTAKWGPCLCNVNIQKVVSGFWINEQWWEESSRKLICQIWWECNYESQLYLTQSQR